MLFMFSLGIMFYHPFLLLQISTSTTKVFIKILVVIVRCNQLDIVHNFFFPIILNF